MAHHLEPDEFQDIKIAGLDEAQLLRSARDDKPQWWDIHLCLSATPPPQWIDIVTELIAGHAILAERAHVEGALVVISCSIDEIQEHLDPVTDLVQVANLRYHTYMASTKEATRMPKGYMTHEENGALVIRPETLEQGDEGPTAEQFRAALSNLVPRPGNWIRIIEGLNEGVWLEVGCRPGGSLWDALIDAAEAARRLESAAVFEQIALRL